MIDIKIVKKRFQIICKLFIFLNFSVETPRPMTRIDTSKFEEAFSSDRLAAAAMAKSEAAALQVRVEGLQSEVSKLYSTIIYKFTISIL